jgi:outer membrane protein
MSAVCSHPSSRRRARSLAMLRPLATGVALALASMLAHAQSLQELYDAARGYDSTYLAARASADAAQARLDQSGALRLPSANLVASSTRNYSDVPKIESNFLATSNQATLQGRQSLYNRANGLTISQAEKAYEIATADLETAEQDLIVRVSQAYFDVLAAQDNLSTILANKTAVTEALASAKRNFEVGTATITDTRDAQAKFDLVVAQEIAARNDLSSKRAALDTTVGRSGVAPKPLAVPVVIPPLARDNVDEWLSGADADNPNVRKARLAFDVAQLETEKARAGHLPTLDLVGSVGTNHNDGVSGVGTGSGTLPGLYKNASIGIQFNLPVFSGFAVQNRVKETLALSEKARDDLDGARRSVALGTRQAFLGVQSGRALVKALEAAESSSQLALEATQLGYKVGVRVTLDVLNAQTQLFTTQRDLAKARYDLVVGSFKLRQAAGQLKPDDVTTVNQLLAR